MPWLSPHSRLHADASYGAFEVGLLASSSLIKRRRDSNLCLAIGVAEDRIAFELHELKGRCELSPNEICQLSDDRVA